MASNSNFFDGWEFRVPRPVHYTNAVGPDGDEENYEYESSDAPPEGEAGVDMPRYRQMVKAKKLEFKAKYGKGHYKGAWLISKWIPGWRRQWKNFKSSGGLKAIKLACKTGDTSQMSAKNITISNKNPFNGVTESHTPAEWDQIYAQYNKTIADKKSKEVTPANNTTTDTTTDNSVADETKSKNEKNGGGKISAGDSDKKILGMKPMVFWIVAIAAVLVIGGGTALVVYRKKIF